MINVSDLTDEQKDFIEKCFERGLSLSETVTSFREKYGKDSTPPYRTPNLIIFYKSLKD